MTQMPPTMTQGDHDQSQDDSESTVAPPVVDGTHLLNVVSKGARKHPGCSDEEADSKCDAAKEAGWEHVDGNPPAGCMEDDVCKACAECEMTQMPPTMTQGDHHQSQDDSESTVAPPVVDGTHLLNVVSKGARKHPGCSDEE